VVFVNSMSDLFHEAIPDEYIAEVFATMALAQQHTFQILTKRPDRMADLLPSAWFRLCWAAALKRTGLLNYAQNHVARYGDSVPPVAAAERLARRVDREPSVRAPCRRAARDAGGGAVHQRRAVARAAAG
jgi:protein gp37